MTQIPPLADKTAWSCTEGSVWSVRVYTCVRAKFSGMLLKMNYPYSHTDHTDVRHSSYIWHNINIVF